MDLGTTRASSATTRTRRGRQRALAVVAAVGLAAGAMTWGPAGAGAVDDPTAAALGTAPTADAATAPENAAAAAGGTTESAGAPEGGVFSPSTQLASWQLYQDLYLTDHDDELAVSSNTPNCQAASTTLNFRQGVLRRVNYFRAMAGVPDGIVLNSNYNALAQRVSLMMSANEQLNHDPPSSWRCYTSAGDAAAGKSNLWITRYGADAVDGWIEDPGSGNHAAGHRRWVLHPPTRQMGIGSVRAPNTHPLRTASALYVMDDHIFDPVARPRDGFVAWPPPGFVPDDLVFDRFSFGIDGANFAGASVAVTRNGDTLSVTRYAPASGYGINTLVFDVPGATTTPATYHVTVRGVSTGGRTQTFEYDINAFDASVPPEPVTITTPARAAEYARGRTVLADYSCQMPDQVSCVGPVADGAPIDTSTLGPHSFTVTATDSSGAEERLDHRYTVVDKTKPSVTVTTPPTGASYVQGQSVTADYACTDDVGGSGLASCVGTVADGAPLNTSVLGASRPFSVAGTDVAGNVRTVDRGFSVTQRPDALIAPDDATAPIGGDLYSASGISTQSSSATVTRGGSHTFLVTVQNDGAAAANLRLKGTVSSGAGYAVTYLRGSTNITSAVQAGTYATGNLEPGALITIKVRVTSLRNGATPGTIKVDLAGRNGAGPFIRDVVRAKVTTT